MDEMNILGLLIQGGSFAVLTFIVVWLTRWVPKRIERNDLVREAEAASRAQVAREHKEAVESQAKAHALANEVLAKAHALASEESLKVFAEQNRYERESCERRHEELMTQLARHYELTREVRHEVANLAHSRAMDRAVKEMQDPQAQKQGPQKGR